VKTLLFPRRLPETAPAGMCAYVSCAPKPKITNSTARQPKTSPPPHTTEGLKAGGQSIPSRPIPPFLRLSENSRFRRLPDTRAKYIPSFLGKYVVHHFWAVRPSALGSDCRRHPPARVDGAVKLSLSYVPASSDSGSEPEPQPHAIRRIVSAVSQHDGSGGDAQFRASSSRASPFRNVAAVQLSPTEAST
jgi:hypothetical protein